MTVTQDLYRFIPETGDLAGRPRVADQSLRPVKLSLEPIFPELLDNEGGFVLLHGRTMPNNLASVKPNERILCQKGWQCENVGMPTDEKPFADIAERIVWHRTLEGLDQHDYATKAGLKRSQLSNWEGGASRVSLDGARKLRKTYGLSLDFIYEGIDDALPMTLRAAWRDRS